MDTRIIERLSVISQEEQRILEGKASIDRDIYMQGSLDVINSKKLLEYGKIITLRPHTRFVDFPEHTHDYVEMVYMCKGTTNHIVNGKEIHLRTGELLILNQRATHQVRYASEEDLAVNFIVLPEFFTGVLAQMEEETPLRRFLVECLFDSNQGPGYLYFQVSEMKSVQNLVENMLISLMSDGTKKRRISSLTMSLLFLELTSHTEVLHAPEHEVVIQILQYVEKNYATGSLMEAAAQLNYDAVWLSREIKRRTGSTYTQIVQKKRLAQAAFLLRTTQQNIADISAAVGYENVSYYHRLFFAEFGMTPKEYRDAGKLQERTLF